MHSVRLIFTPENIAAAAAEYAEVFGETPTEVWTKIS
jgi:hypothetical protein